MQSSAAGFHIQQSLPTGFMSLVWDLAGELPTNNTGCSPLLSGSVVVCLTLSAAELRKSVSQSMGLSPQCLGEAETWQSLGYEPGEPGSPRDGVVLLPEVCSILPMHLQSPSGASERQMTA